MSTFDANVAAPALAMVNLVLPFVLRTISLPVAPMNELKVVFAGFRKIPAKLVVAFVLVNTNCSLSLETTSKALFGVVVPTPNLPGIVVFPLASNSVNVLISVVKTPLYCLI
jgi:hypothetical protein